MVAIRARELLDSRGSPTVEAEVELDSGARGRSIVPSGASTGTHEAHELRDNDPLRYGGRGVLQAAANVRGEIANALCGMSAEDQGALDARLIELDGTPEKSRLGANAILSVSLAAAHAAAAAREMPLFLLVRSLASAPGPLTLPLPLCNILNGGAHTNWETTDIQEFMLAPIGAKTFGDSVRMLAEIFHALKRVLAAEGYATAVGDEGGFAPALKEGNEEALRLMSAAVGQAGYRLGSDVAFALDAAASEFVDGSAYTLAREGKTLSSADMTAWYAKLASRYPILSIEDGLSESDWTGWSALTQRLPGIQIVGDDLFVTNVEFLKRGIRERAGNAILIKPNQIGTLTETIAAVDTAHQAGWRCVMSHRSGETEDTTIAHLAVGLGTGQIKTGSMSRTDRIAKYNELLRIEESLGKDAVFAGNVFA